MPDSSTCDKAEPMTDLHPLVESNMTLTHDGQCGTKGHELVPRACIHCGLTIHQIAADKPGGFQLRETPNEMRETISQAKRYVKQGEKQISEQTEELNAYKSELMRLEKKLAAIECQNDG